ncbi:glucose 1-dehydrogenase [Chitinophaga costaii]|uniref:Glucose 1-dehydrogenase n=1 Tax=Chitinophaga costaii TaxID=1335309 RepID=A0A1C3Z9P7_9BACT|nr:SDR family oxidoreductase [Chitinophaga costaii]PUZ30284.1 3-oxoacyl-ACP reductase [Chitinophaga costaii]SCB78992.1 glucose 1-dehydrogenase [Chitinophaga costaii]
MSGSLQNQVAIVTGSSSGIGEGVALALSKAGATVVINHSRASSRSEADAVLAKITAQGGQAIIIQCDVSQEQEVQQMFAQTIQAFGTVDILVSNAGLQQDAAFTDMTLEQWNKVIGINLTGQFLCTREAIKEFMRRGVVPSRSTAAGKIICMSSVHEVIPWAGHANYAASKGGIKLLMQTIAQEFAPHKIRVNSIAPGAIRTRINQEAWNTPAAASKLLELIPYGRIGEAEDIGKAAVFLASDDSDYITGTTLFVDGGMTLYPGFAGNG